jgi:hypothetical protein
MFKRFLIILAVVFGLLLVFVATRPSEMKVQRSTLIEAPIEVAYSFVADFHRWGVWSPWDGLDPKMTRTFRGAASGPGAIYEWEGNDDVGSGRMTIAEAQPPRSVAITLEFLKPIAATHRTTFQFDVNPGGTKVTWTMEGHNNFAAKFFSVVMNMDQLIGGDFEKGLAAMKTAAEASAREPKVAPAEPAIPAVPAPPDAAPAP